MVILMCCQQEEIYFSFVPILYIVGLTHFVSVLQEGENLTKEQLANEIQKIKQAHADDEGTYLFKKLYTVDF